MPDFVQTVTGPVSRSALGRTLCHEHLLIDRSGIIADPGSRSAEFDEPIQLRNLYDVRRAHRNVCDLRLDSVEDAIEELSRLPENGIFTVVEVTPTGIGRNPAGLAEISRATGVNIVMGCGYYVAAFHPDGLETLDEERIAAAIVEELRHGVGETQIRPGVIGEVGLGWPPASAEVKVLRAAARAQAETGVALVVHPGRDPASPFACLDIVAEAGGDPTRCVVSHVDRTLFTAGDLRRLAATGCYLSFDLFGVEQSFYAPSPIDMPNDAVRIDRIRTLFDAGYARSVVISHDICVKTRLGRYGGEGYGHIPARVLPVFARKGFTGDELDLLMVENPAAMLTGRTGEPRA